MQRPARAANYARCRQVEIDFHGEGLAAKVVDDIERSEPATVPERVGHEVDGPTAVDRLAGHPSHHCTVIRRARIPAEANILMIGNAPQQCELRQVQQTGS